MMRNIGGLVPHISEHGRRTARLSAGLAAAMRFNHSEVTLIVLAALLHDIGKISVPEEILNKPGALNDAERKIIKRHVLDGYHMLPEHIPEEVAEMVLYHHENVDGSGYLGMKGNRIPMGARIIRICDVYDALMTARPYKKAWEQGPALAYIYENRDTLFDASCAEAFCDMMHRMRTSVQNC